MGHIQTHSAENQAELERLRRRIETLERTVKLGTVEFVLDEAIKQPLRVVKRTKRVTKY